MQSKNEMVRQKWMRSNSAPPRLSNLRVKRRTPTEHVGWRSTETVLNCSANGGRKGGFAYFSLEGADGLIQYEGPTLPYSKSLEPEEKISFKCRYRATKASESEGDIKVTATFVENETWATQDVKDMATAVRIELNPVLIAPKNDSDGRHVYGVREEVYCRYSPSTAPVSWEVGPDCRMNGEIFTCPLDAATNPLSISGGTTTYTPNVSVIEPSGIESRNAEMELFGVPTNHAGGIGMKLEFYVLPLEVSFEKISIEEVPCTEGTHSGYFAFSNFSSEWSHTVERGAGRWMNVRFGNYVGTVHPALRAELPRVTEDGIFIDDDSYGWIDGELIWNVPFGWNESDTVDGTAEHKRFGQDIKQQMVIFETGRCGVRKLKNMIYRDIDGTVNLNGRIVHEE